MKKVYLSVDLDYWTGDIRTKRGMEQFVNKIIDKYEEGMPVKLVLDHHRLLNHVNKFEVDTLINVDYHSDIVEETANESLDCGSWITFVRDKGEMHVTWCAPNYKECVTHGAGRCDDWFGPYNTQEGVLERPEIAGWKSIYTTEGVGCIPWGNVVAIGVAVSPNYWGVCPPSQMLILRKLNEVLGQPLGSLDGWKNPRYLVAANSDEPQGETRWRQKAHVAGRFTY